MSPLTGGTGRPQIQRLEGKMEIVRHGGKPDMGSCGLMATELQLYKVKEL